jgi:hypothetical protein
LHDAEEFFVDLRKESDAALVVLAMSYIDAHLSDAWKRNMPGKSTTTYDLLFENAGPLSNMSSKIRLAHGLSWLRDDTAADLHTLRKIRNRFAHDPYKKALSDPDIVSLIESMTNVDKTVLNAIGDDTEIVELTPRTKFHLRAMLVCFHAAIELLAAPIAARHRVPLGAVVGSFDDGPESRRETARTVARAVLSVVGFVNE